MAIDIKFDLVGNPEPPTIILATRNGNKLGQLDIDETSIELKDVLNDASEITFTLNKYIDGKITNLWNDVTNFKLVYCKEWDTWFEITVELDEETETVKTVFCTQLGQAELSQLMLYNIEINTEKDIERDDYKIAILYDAFEPEASILHRVLKDKAPHYSIVHVDSTIANIQRSFSFNDISIYDALQEIAEEIGCLFVFHSNSGDIQNIINEDSVALYEVLTNEQHKIEEWGLSEFGNAFDTSGDSFSRHRFGNVDMDNRIIITWSDDLKSNYSNALASWDYNPEVGSIDTVFGGSSRFGEDVLETGIEVAYTSIVNTDEKAIFVSKDVLYNYIEEIISESIVDGVCNKDIVLHLDNNGRHIDGIFIHNVIAAIDLSLDYDNNGNWAETVGRLMHFSGKYGSISLAHKDIIEYSKNIGISFEEFIFAHQNGTNKSIRRTISVYDLEQNCLNEDCKHRGNFTDVCPKCGSKNIKYGYGEDTTIFVTADELASGGIQLTTDTDAVKNCFKLEAGDDLMTATIRNCNPNGTDYIWRFSDDTKKDMPFRLVKYIELYDKKYKEYYSDYVSNLDVDLLNKYNALVDKYSVYNKELEKITTPIKGYSSLTNAYYNAIDLELYLESSFMPSVEMSSTTALEQARLLTSSSLSPVAVANIEYASKATVDNAVLSMAKTIVKPTYRIKIKNSEFSEGIKRWTGDFIVTNYSDEEDTAISYTVYVDVSDDVEKFVEQKLKKTLNKEDEDNLSVTGLFKKEIILDNDGEHSVDENGVCECSFCAELKKYALKPLLSFRDACQACINVLIEQDIGSDKTSDLYKNLYAPYYNKLMAIEAEIAIREKEINIISGIYDINDDLIEDGLKQNIEKHQTKIQDELNFEKYLGEELWLEFCSYRREDKYSNNNYISDGLNNAELFKKSLEFFEVAENEIYKASELQHSISTSLNNLLAIPKFKSFVNSFKVGNWIRIQVNNEIYKLRLLEYDIDFGDFDNIKVEFSDVTKVKNGISDVESVLSQASSMATSYDSIQRQANQGNKVKGTVDEWVTNGLNSALVRIQNNNNEEITMTENGLLCRTYDDVSDTYSPEQLKLTHNIMAYTNDGWKTVKQAIGKHDYKCYERDGEKCELVTKTGYGMTAEFVTAGYVNGSQIIGGEVYSKDYVAGKKGSYINLDSGTFEFGGGKITFNGTELIINPDNGLGITSDEVVEIADGRIKAATILASQIDTKGLIAENISATELTGKNIVGGSLSIGYDSSYTSNENPEIWVQNEDPEDTERWNTNTKRSKHIGDLWYNTDEDVYYEYTSDYEWIEYSDVSNAGGYTTYAEITSKGILNCKGANISGHINATSGTIGGCEIIDNTLTVGEANISSVSADAITAGTIDAEISINSPNIYGGNIYGGMFYATGQGDDGGAAYYIYDDDYESGNLVGYISYDTNGSGEKDDDGNVIEAENRVIFKTMDIPLKLESGSNMSFQANGKIFMNSSTQFNNAIILQGSCFGDKLPTTGKVYGRLFFLLA